MAACTVDSEDGQMTFGPTTNPTSFTTTMTATTVDPSGSTTDDVSTSGGSDPSTSGNDADSDSAGTSAASTAEDTGGSEQPEDGMYSHCTDVMDCFSQNTCVVVEPGDGFCSTYPCADAASCDASPGGTAAPICAEVTVPTGMSTACALDCSGGETCPGGMICAALGTGMVCT